MIKRGASGVSFLLHKERCWEGGFLGCFFTTLLRRKAVAVREIGKGRASKSRKERFKEGTLSGKTPFNSWEIKR